jgi:hypothetical protein
MSKYINILGIIVGTIGIFFGFYYLDFDPELAIKIVTFTTVGIVGTLAFVRHFIFHESDAKRLGWETDRPDWIFEVGFANLAFGLMGLISVIANLGIQTQSITLLGYSIYLFQAAMLHGYRYFTDELKSASRLWSSFLATLLFAGMMAFFALWMLL